MCGDAKYYMRLWKKQAEERKELEKQRDYDTATTAAQVINNNYIIVIEMTDLRV